MKKLHTFRRSLALTPAVLAIGCVIAASIAQDAPPPPVVVDEAVAAPAAPDLASLPYLRVQEQRDRRVALEVAARTFTRADGAGPSITLVGVAHIGEASLYRELQKLLDEHDIVLYESVMPPGARAPQGEGDEEKSAATQASIDFLASIIETYRAAHAALPESLDSLDAFVGEKDSRLIHFRRNTAIDAWGKPLIYTPLPDDNTYSLTSLGSDRAPGGESHAADLFAHDPNRPAPVPLPDGGEGLQADLATALGLQFQLVAVDYNRPNWICSDMTMGELQAAFRERGLSFGEIGGALAGSSLPARMVKMFLWLMKSLDAFAEGRITDLMKVAMIEVLGDEKLVGQALGQQMGEGFKEVLIDDRNQVVMDDLRRIIETHPAEGDAAPKSIAIFYGAAHLPDFAERLAEQFNYHPMSNRWFTAMEVDFQKSRLSPAEVRQIRMTLRQAIRQQLRQR